MRNKPGFNKPILTILIALVMLTGAAQAAMAQYIANSQALLIDAIRDVLNNGTITITGNITLTSPIVINKPGVSFTITSGAGGPFRIMASGSSDTYGTLVWGGMIQLRSGILTFQNIILDGNNINRVINIGEQGVTSATLNIRAGTVITRGLAARGGGIYLQHNDSVLNMYDGIITLNTSNGTDATRTGGVYLNAGVFNMYGGTISNNTDTGSAAGSAGAGGVYVSANNQFRIHNSSVPIIITGSTSNDWGTLVPSNVLVNWATATRSGSPAPGSLIGIRSNDSTNPTIVVTGAVSGDQNFFFSDNTSRIIDITGSNIRLNTGTTTLRTITVNNSGGSGGMGNFTVPNGRTLPDRITTPSIVPTANPTHVFDGYYSAAGGNNTKYYDKDGVRLYNTAITGNITMIANLVAPFTPITSAAITVNSNATPATGGTRGTTAIASGTNFTLGTTTWSPNHTTFAGNTAYTVSVVLNASAGYGFPATGFSATINGSTATLGTNTGGAITISRTFTTGPAAPTVGTPTVPTAAGFTANWTAPAGGSAATISYRLDVSTNSSTFSPLVGTPNNTTAISGLTQAVTGLTANTNYYYRVRAVTTNGTSDNSEVSTVVATLPGTPTGLTITPASITTNGFTATWTAPTGGSANTVSYRLQVSTSSGFTAGTFVTGFDGADPISGTTQAVSGLSAGTTYYVRVLASTTVGNGAYITGVTTITLPVAPVANAATAVNLETFTANWAATTSATSYRLDVSTSPTFASFVPGLEDITVTGTNRVLTGLHPGVTYYYRVRAVNASGAGASSNVINLTTHYQLTDSLTGTTLSPLWVAAGSNYSGTLTADTGYDLPETISIYVNNVLLTAGQYTYNSATGVITINSSYINGNIEIIGAGIGSTYTVTFNTNPGTGSGAITAGTASVVVTFGVLKPRITPPTRIGYNFNGYFTAASGGTKYYHEDGTSALIWDIDDDTTLFAQWTARTYTVTLNRQGEVGTSSIDSGAVSFTATFDSTALGGYTAPARAGYTFAGYYTAINGGGSLIVNTGGTLVSGVTGFSTGTGNGWSHNAAVTLHAHWTVKTYDITFNTNAGTGSGTITAGTTSQTATYDAAMPVVTPPSRIGYTFSGYFDSASGGNRYYNANGTSARTWNIESSTLFAQWTAHSYTITLDRQDGTDGTDTFNVSFDDTSLSPYTAPVREGYIFAGFWTATSGGDMVIDANGDFEANRTGYTNSNGQWTSTSGSVPLVARWDVATFGINLDSNGGTGGAVSHSVIYNAVPSQITSRPTQTG